MLKIIFATGNRHKLEEVQAILGDSFEVVTPMEVGINEDIPETADTLEGNASMKSGYIWKKTGLSCFADDTGLEVEALDGAPGVYSARYAGEDKDSAANMAKLLEALKGKENRKARFRTVISLIEEDGRELLFEGIVNGHIGTECAGEMGFGYDPLFIPENGTKTMAQMSAEEKNAISHRGLAVRKLAAYLRNRER